MINNQSNGLDRQTYSITVTYYTYKYADLHQMAHKTSSVSQHDRNDDMTISYCYDMKILKSVFPTKHQKI